MKKENGLRKLSNQQSLITTIFTAICLVFVMGAASVSFADDDYDGDDDSQGHEYVLSLGDSLSVGVQPNLTTGFNERTNDGYADELVSRLLKISDIESAST